MRPRDLVVLVHVSHPIKHWKEGDRFRVRGVSRDGSLITVSPCKQPWREINFRTYRFLPVNLHVDEYPCRPRKHGVE